jgi:hypothetical protein
VAESWSLPTFRAGARPIPADMRAVWRIAVLVLMLAKCRARTASIKQLHILNWALRNPNAWPAFQRAYIGKPHPEDATLRFDPTLDRTIDRAIGDRLVEWTANGRLRLTSDGDVFGELLHKSELLVEPRELLASVPGLFTQARFEQIAAQI